MDEPPPPGSTASSPARHRTLQAALSCGCVAWRRHAPASQAATDVKLPSTPCTSELFVGDPLFCAAAQRRPGLTLQHGAARAPRAGREHGLLFLARGRLWAVGTAGLPKPDRRAGPACCSRALELAPWGRAGYIDLADTSWERLPLLAAIVSIMYWHYLMPLVAACAAAQTTTPTALWPTQTFVTEPFHPIELVVNKTGATAEGYLFFATEGENATITPLIISDSGELVWQLDLSDSPPPPDAAQQLFMQFDVQRLDGNSYLTYFNGTRVVGHAYGAIHVLDHAYNQVYRVCLNPPGGVIPTTPNLTLECHGDQHESQFTHRGTILQTVYNATRADLTSVGGPQHGWVIDAQFYEIDIKTGEIKFAWKGLEHLDKIPISMSHYPPAAENGTSLASIYDYFHINSVSLLPDGGYLISSRHLWAVIKLSETGDVEWILPGDRIGDDFSQLNPPNLHFSWQHHTRVTKWTDKGGLLHMHNNANYDLEIGEEPTSGLLMELDLSDPKKRTATLLKNFTDPNNLVYSFAEGSYQPQPNANVLIGHGFVPEIKEYSSDGAIAMTATFGYNNMMTNSYRAYRYPWVGRPSYPPKAKAVNPAAGGVGPASLYMSWNGATEYDGWVVYTGTSAGDLKFFANVSRAGFETGVILRKPTHGFAQAKAVAKGEVLGETSVVQF